MAEWPTIPSEFYRFRTSINLRWSIRAPKGATMSDLKAAATSNVNSSGLSDNAAAGIA
jgi:hypothetical protein